MNKIHIWVGLTHKTTADFNKYFEINKLDKKAGLGASQFCQDIGITWYDDDLIGVYKSDTTDDLLATLDEIPMTPAVAESVQKRCRELGMERANAMFYYADSDLVVRNPGLRFNDLCYLGMFDNK